MVSSVVSAINTANSRKNLENSLFSAEKPQPYVAADSLSLRDTHKSSPSEKLIWVNEQDTKGETRIFHAVRANDLKSLYSLLQSGANIAHKNKAQQTAADLSYQQGYWQCLLLLIQFGSLFPKKFDVHCIPETELEFLKLIERNNRIADLIISGPVKSLAELIEAGYFSKSFINLQNQSAIYVAFLHKRYEEYVFLKFKGFTELWHETPIDTSVLSKLERQLIKNIMATYKNLGIGK